LMKYKLQTLISIVSIAIGIVTLSLVHSLISAYRLPSIFYESYYDRAYKVRFNSSNNGDGHRNVIRAIRKDGGPKSAEKLTVSIWNCISIPTEFQLSDSTIRKGQVAIRLMDQEYADFIGLRSSVTGKKIRKLKHGEAIVSANFAKAKFQEKNPIGAVQTFTLLSELPIPVTIVDVYDPVPLSDWPMDNDGFYFCYGNGMEDYDFSNSFFTEAVYVILKEGCTKQQLLKEINDAIKPFDLTAEIIKVSDNPEIKKIIAIRALSYLIGSLILLAAIIGFLRIQTQMFRMRRHELALRIVNGASRIKLFGLLFAEVAITICCAVALALFLGFFLQDFLDKKLDYFMDSSVFKVSNLWLCSIAIGGCLIVICSITAWLTLRSVCQTNHGLSVYLRRSHHRLFHQVMLGIQIVIVMIVVSSTFILLNAEDKIIEACHMPENDSDLKEYLYWEPDNMTFNELYDEIKRLPDLEKIVKYATEYMRVQEIHGNPELSDYSKYNSLFNVYCTDDTTILSSLGIDIQWLNKNIDRTKCLLIDEKLYSEFKELGVLDHNTLSIGESYNGFTLPVGGIIRSIAYDMQGDKIIAISPEWGTFSNKNQILIPKPGKGKSLLQSVNETIERVDPEDFNKRIFKYREKVNVMPDLVESLRIGGWILCCVSLIICAMSILSTITLDTRGRRKDVAIRKVNGAKSWDIYKKFGKIYVIMLLISLALAIPVCILFNQMVEERVAEIVPGSTLSPVVPLILGIAIVSLLIILIVWWQIRKMIRIYPAKIIAKE
ncbi:MAG: FtsX-like permease family protein, partial [Muribaculaceae bacterium]|nr:FtsX-like permease family protein [Muribaculaceae bacterium]